MATVSNDDPEGANTWRVQFVAGDGKRRAIRLGKVGKTTAAKIAERVDAINAALIIGQPINRDLAEWLAGLGDTLYEKFVRVGLVSPRALRPASTTLGDFAKDFLAKRKGSKESTLVALRIALVRLPKYFGDEVPLESITPGQADDWVLWMQVTEKYAPATISRTVKRAKQLFLSAVRLELLKRNPFEHLKAGKQTNDSRKAFVDQTTAVRVIGLLPDMEWRLVFALSRFGGLRCPSEHLALKWSDIDWEKNRFTVRARKTGERVVPLFAELRPFVEAAFDAAPEGAVYVIGKRRASAQRWGMLLGRILASAGVSKWERIFHNLRASRQTELTARYSIGTVCRWMGNSVEVADAHYLTAQETEFERAASEGAEQKAAHKAAQQTETNVDKAMHTRTDEASKTLEMSENGKISGSVASPRGARKTPQKHGENIISDIPAAHDPAHGLENLAASLRRDLTDADRLALVKLLEK